MKVKEIAGELEKIVGKIFDGDADDELKATYDEASEELSIFPTYAAKIDFHVDDIKEKLADGTLEVWTKRNTSEALRALAVMIMDKAAELDGGELNG